MALPKGERCPCWGYASVHPLAWPGRVVRYRNAALTMPAELRLPACWRCKYELLALNAVPAELLESLCRADLRQRVALAVARVQHYLPQRRTELLLALLAAHQQQLAELEAYWTLPPA